jgi:predicted regulator of Ras-like GTPase activity (Roadblock/LC7/MglB family)
MSVGPMTNSEKRLELQKILEQVESKSRLEALAVVTWSGIRIASSSSTSIDADEYSAASAAIVSLGDMTVKRMNEGRLIQVVVRGDQGYTILTRSGPETLLVGVGREQFRFGYYLDLLIKTAIQIAEVIAAPTADKDGEPGIVEPPVGVPPVTTPSGPAVSIPAPAAIQKPTPATGSEAKSSTTASASAKTEIGPPPAKQPIPTPLEPDGYPPLIQTVPIPKDTEGKQEERKAILEALKVIGMIGEEPKDDSQEEKSKK